MIRGKLKIARYVAAVLVGVALLAALSTAEAQVQLYWQEVGGILVGYSNPLFDAYWDSFDDTLTVEVLMSGGPLVIKATEIAPIFWGPYCDVYILADFANITTVKLKGHDMCPLYVCGYVDFANKFILKNGVVGNTDYWGPDFGLYRDSLFGPKKIAMKWGYSTGAVLASSTFASLSREKGEKPCTDGACARAVSPEEKVAMWEAMKAQADESGEDEDDEIDKEFEEEDASADVDVSPGDKVAIFQSLLLNAK
jgi:hypothetical protein